MIERFLFWLIEKFGSNLDSATTIDPKFENGDVVYFAHDPSIFSYESVTYLGKVYRKGYINKSGSFFSNFSRKNHYVVSPQFNLGTGLILPESELIILEDLFTETIGEQIKNLEDI